MAKTWAYQDSCSSTAHDQPNEHVDGDIVRVGGCHAKVQRQTTEPQDAEAGRDNNDKDVDDFDNRDELCGCSVGGHVRAHPVLSTNNDVRCNPGREDQSKHSKVLVEPDAFHSLPTALCVYSSEEPEC